MRAQQDFARSGGSTDSGFTWVSFWSRHVDFKTQGGPSSSSSSSGEESFNLRDPAARRMAELATAATRALRRWHMYQRLCKPLKALGDGRASL
jgi:hypothetical protein